MIQQQKELVTSIYTGLYDILVPKDNELRKINEMIDFSFIFKELKPKYCLDNGRSAEDPVRMFKYLLLKMIFKMSDRGLCRRAFTDMSFKYFLGIAPEAQVIDSSLLSKFRRQRLKDSNLLDILVGETVRIAIEKGIIAGKQDIIVDSTHTSSLYHAYSRVKYLQPRVSELKKVCSSFKGVGLTEEEMKPSCPIDTYDSMLDYCNRIVALVDGNEVLAAIPSVAEKLDYLKEGIDDTESGRLLCKDAEAKFGHKTKSSRFLGYKEHIGMTTDRIIVSAVVTTGEKDDGKVLPALVEKAEENGVQIESCIGDTAYSGKDNLADFEERDMKLVAPLNPVISDSRDKVNEFEYNKDAGMFVCPAGHMAVSKREKPGSKKNNNRRMTYFFDVEKCRRCPLREGCYKKGAKCKSYSVTILSKTHLQQMEFEKSEEFRRKMKERYKIEAKNSELKNIYGMGKTESYGIQSMTMQAAMAIFVANIKRIMTSSGK